jgi:hypothetical protein
MENHLPESHDSVADDPLVPSDGLSDAAPPNNSPPDPPDQPSDAALPEAPGTPDADSEPNVPASPSDAQSNDPNANDAPASGAPEAPAPPTTNIPKCKQPRAERPNKPEREHNILKKNRDGVGGVKTPEGKAISSLNSFKHGIYSRLPFYLMPGESQEQYDALLDRLRTEYPPIDESSAQMLELHVQAFYRLGRCNHAEYLAESADRTNLEKFLRSINTVGMHRTRCERSYYLHLDKTEAALGGLQNGAGGDSRENARRGTGMARRRSETEAAFQRGRRRNGPNLSAILDLEAELYPGSPCNEVYEFDRTLKGKMSVKRTPLRDWEGGRLLHPSFKPNGMKHDWPDHLLGPWKDYYKNLKREENKDP